MISVKLSKVALAYYAALGGPVAERAAKAVHESDWLGLVSLSVSPRAYTSPSDYYRDACAAAFLKKFSGRIDGLDRRAACLQKWWEAERSCYLTNQRLTRYCTSSDSLSRGGSYADCEPAPAELLLRARKIIRSWIGSGPPDMMSGRFGPGATFSDPSKRATVPDKMASNPTLTPGAVMSLLGWVGTLWSRHVTESGGELSFVRGNRFATAPKTSLIDRPIAVEPSINVFFQLGLGQALRRRLRSASGWDLDTAADIHREVARRSSVDREFATLDLSSASDTVARELVRALVPPLWWQALNELRSPFTRIDGKWTMLEKFSSMGNGFTFELETIIFAAISKAAASLDGCDLSLGRDLFVFGDDIIVPEGVRPVVVAALKWCGFHLNDEKSFWGEVPFRESCGADYFNGVRVRPFYQKKELQNVQAIFSLANGIAKHHPVNADEAMAGVWRLAVGMAPRHFRQCRGPSALGDVVLHTDDSREWTIRWVHGQRQIQALTLRPRKLPWGHWPMSVEFATRVYMVRDLHDGLTPRDPRTAYGKGWVASP